MDILIYNPNKPHKVEDIEDIMGSFQLNGIRVWSFKK